jgi:hypothetical protein
VTEATYYSTITEAPSDTVTVFVGVNGETSTEGLSTIYEVYIYTTTQTVDYVGDTWECGVDQFKKLVRETAISKVAFPTYVEAKATSTV